MATSSKKKQTPLMRQYYEVKSQHPDALLLFRVGDFYETFAEDAIKTAEILGIILTNRNNGGSKIPLAGFPYHSLDSYLPKLVRAGFRVAICEQLEKPSKEKKLVKRGITDIVTPGVTTNDHLLETKQNNYLASIYIPPKKVIGISLLDISTGEFLVSEGNSRLIKKIIQSYQPNEVIFPTGHKKQLKELVDDQIYTYGLDDWVFSQDYAIEKLSSHFNNSSFKGYGIDDLLNGQIAAGGILHYLQSTKNNKIGHINKIARIHNESFVWLDKFTIRNLELVCSNHVGGVPLINILDHTTSPLGARLLKKWVLMPLVDYKIINKRLSVVESFLEKEILRNNIIEQLNIIGDLERYISKAAVYKINPKELKQLEKALFAIDPIQKALKNSQNDEMIIWSELLQNCSILREKISTQILDEAPINLNKGNIFKTGFNKSYDELQDLIKNSKQILVDLQHREAEKTGIQNLKIGFNNVFGYYLEVTNKYKDKGLVPEEWIRKQTLTNAERYITEELKILEEKIINAQSKLKILEESLFTELIDITQEYIEPIQTNSKVLAKIDCLISFARLAFKHNYCKPIVDNSLDIKINEGRHPVIEQKLPIGESYIPNDVFLDNASQQIIMITGPNMSGKSAVLRQTALIVLLAQMGCYVPATEAQIGTIDKIFTRVGASDNISSGESTFMVEMNETASIMNNISARSLILLDEIGRGTSTYDGISIAWSLAEYLHECPESPKTLFATHYHELNELSIKFARIKNFNVSTKEVANKVLFLRKLVEGGSQHSFGIHVAKMAGMPSPILTKAKILLKRLEQKSLNNSVKEKLKDAAEGQKLQLSFFNNELRPELIEIEELLQSLTIDEMTPIDCMMTLKQLIELLKD